MGSVNHAPRRRRNDDHDFALSGEALRIAWRRVGAEENYGVCLRRIEAAGVKSSEETVALGLGYQFPQLAGWRIGLGAERARVIAALGRKDGQLSLLAAVVVDDRHAIVRLDQ